MFHTVLLADIRKRMDDWDENTTCIADIFLNFLHYLKVFILFFFFFFVLFYFIFWFFCFLFLFIIIYFLFLICDR